MAQHSQLLGIFQTSRKMSVSERMEKQSKNIPRDRKTFSKLLIIVIFKNNKVDISFHTNFAIKIRPSDCVIHFMFRNRSNPETQITLNSFGFIYGVPIFQTFSD